MNEDKIIQELLKDLEKIEADLIKRIEAALKAGYFKIGRASCRERVSDYV